MSRFTIEAVIRGYHMYKSIWLNPIMEKSFHASGRLEMPKTLTLFLKVLQYQHFANTSELLKRTI